MRICMLAAFETYGLPSLRIQCAFVCLQPSKRISSEKDQPWENPKRGAIRSSTGSAINRAVGLSVLASLRSCSFRTVRLSCGLRVARWASLVGCPRRDSPPNNGTIARAKQELQAGVLLTPGKLTSSSLDFRRAALSPFAEHERRAGRARPDGPRRSTRRNCLPLAAGPPTRLRPPVRLR